MSEWDDFRDTIGNSTTNMPTQTDKEIERIATDNAVDIINNSDIEASWLGAIKKACINTANAATSHLRVNLSTDELSVNYYEKQIADQTKWCNEILENKEMSVTTKLKRYSDMIIYWAGCYVHGANLAAALLEISQLRGELEKAQSKLEIECARETCKTCNQSWNPSLIESGQCVFCTLKFVKEAWRKATAEVLEVQETNARSFAMIEKLEDDLKGCLDILPIKQERDQALAAVRVKDDALTDAIRTMKVYGTANMGFSIDRCNAALSTTPPTKVLAKFPTTNKG